MAPLAAYLTPQTTRRFPGPIHHATGRFRYALFLEFLINVSVGLYKTTKLCDVKNICAFWQQFGIV